MGERIKFVLTLQAGGALETNRCEREGPSREKKAVTDGVLSNLSGNAEGRTISVAIQAGEDIGEVILSSLHGNLPSHLEELALSSFVLTASGAVLRPLLVADGVPVPIPSDEEFFSIMKLQGSFSVDREGTAKMNFMTILCADSRNTMFGGAISGALIAAAPTQVTLFVI